ncbi:CMRF35-like molecule 8 isoform X10 [Dicentrarchus labrax]|uniref:CMRF35-like molecule 8 isoform X10 n=2 Tax=Dicentrarchus labrax TaxID=13489 RepID=UPI0021F63785|nr:CMRF35-like molecule 8 isoform X10 [Dicentrarchus labrax]
MTKEQQDQHDEDLSAPPLTDGRKMAARDFFKLRTERLKPPSHVIIQETNTETNRGFSVSISNVSSHDAGLYWCGVNKGNYQTGLRKIQLKVEDIRTFTKSPTIGQNFTYWCEYKNDPPIKKFICKGEDPSICQPLITTQQKKNTKFSMKEDKEKRNITITVREVTADDSGTYWCGAESTDRRRSNTFFHRFLMTVVKTPTSTSPASSTQSTPASPKRNVQTSTSTSPVSSTATSAERDGGSQVVITVGVCVAVLLLLLFVIILILIYKRRSHSKHTRTGAAAQHTREDYVYEEVQVYVQKPDSGNAVTTIYATANFPTNPSASLHYSTINFKNSSDKAGGEAVILKPSSSACEYSTVKNSQSPTYSTVNEPSRSPEDPLYSTVNKPKD